MPESASSESILVEKIGIDFSYGSSDDPLLWKKRKLFVQIPEFRQSRLHGAGVTQRIETCSSPLRGIFPGIIHTQWHHQPGGIVCNIRKHELQRTQAPNHFEEGIQLNSDSQQIG